MMIVLIFSLGMFVLYLLIMSFKQKAVEEPVKKNTVITEKKADTERSKDETDETVQSMFDILNQKKDKPQDGEANS